MKGFQKNDGSWEEAVCNVMQDLSLGCLSFTIVVVYIQDSFQSRSEAAMMELEQLKDKIEQRQPRNAEEQLEQRFLLKEFRIGCRSQHPPTWTGLVSSMDGHRKDCHGKDRQHSEDDVQQVLVQMRAKPASMQVQLDGYEELCELARDNPDNITVIVAAGSIPAVLAAIMAHMGDTGMQMQGCALLGNLATNTDNQTAIATAGSIPVVLAAIKTHKSHEGVQEQG